MQAPAEADRSGTLVRAWAIVAAATPVHIALGLATDLSPDEAYYLAAARLHRAIADHPPLTLWLLALGDRCSFAPVELRVRIFAIAFSLATSAGCVALARSRGADREGCTLAAWLSSWALLPMAGGFVMTPDTPLLLAVVVALLALASDRNVVAGLALFAASLAKVVALPIAALLALPSRHRTRLALFAGCALASPLLVPSLRFQLHHAFVKSTAVRWSPLEALGAVGAAIGAQALLWSPFVLWYGLRGLPRPDRALVLGLSALVTASALVRAVPPEPNWWAPAAIVVLIAFARSAAAVPRWARHATLAMVIVPTAIAAVHTARPFLPLATRADPTARLHGWSTNHPPLDAPGIGLYGAAAERCIYGNDCSTIINYFDDMKVNE